MFFLTVIISGIALFAPVIIAHAHEVYVLDQDTIDTAIAQPSGNVFTAVTEDSMDFFIWVMIGIVVVTTVFFVSILRPVEKFFDPMLFALKRKFGFIVVRATIGLSLIASGYYHAFFGPELPLSTMFGQYETLASYILMLVGSLILIGLFTRIAGTVAILYTIYAIYTHGWYMLTYTNYMGDILFVAFLGAHIWSVDKHVLHWHGVLGTIERFIEKYAFLMLRITFGCALIYASIYAKIIHNDLALQVVLQYNLTDYFHFAPLFIVLGASLVEITLGMFFILGIEVRFTALFMMAFLTLSLLYFGEAVWPHIVLFGGALALFIHGYDRYSLEGYFFKNAQHEPVL